MNLMFLSHLLEFFKPMKLNVKKIKGSTKLFSGVECCSELLNKPMSGAKCLLQAANTNLEIIYSVQYKGTEVIFFFTQYKINDSSYSILFGIAIEAAASDMILSSI